MADHLPKEQIQQILHRGSSTFEPETVSKLVQLGADPLWRDLNLSCIDKALADRNGNLTINTC